MPDISHVLFAAPAAFALLALAGLLMRAGRAPFRLGLAAAACGYSAAQALWAASPHSPWVNLIFQLFPAPVAYETARLLFVLLVVKPPLEGKAAPFALGFAGFETLAAAGVFALANGAPPTLAGAEGGIVLPLLLFAMHGFFSLALFAMVGRKWPPFAPFTILMILHGGTRGGLLALSDPGTRLTAEVMLIAAYGALAFWLLRSDALRQEDRRGLG